MAGAGLRRLVAIGTGANPHDPEVLDLWFELASLCAEQGEHDEAFRLWSEIARVMPDSAAGAVTSLRASRAAMQSGRREDAWRQLDLARARTSADPVLAVEVLAQEAGLRSNLDRQSDAARVTAARALDAARSLAGAALGPANLEGDVRRAYLAAALAGADAARRGDDPVEMLALAEEVAASAAGVDDTIEASALVQGAMALRFLGRNGEAEVRLRDAWDSGAAACAAPGCPRDRCRARTSAPLDGTHTGDEGDPSRVLVAGGASDRVRPWSQLSGDAPLAGRGDYG